MSRTSTPLLPRGHTYTFYARTHSLTTWNCCSEMRRWTRRRATCVISWRARSCCAEARYRQRPRGILDRCSRLIGRLCTATALPPALLSEAADLKRRAELRRAPAPYAAQPVAVLSGAAVALGAKRACHSAGYHSTGYHSTGRLHLCGVAYAAVPYACTFCALATAPKAAPRFRDPRWGNTRDIAAPGGYGRRRACRRLPHECVRGRRRKLPPRWDAPASECHFELTSLPDRFLVAHSKES